MVNLHTIQESNNNKKWTVLKTILAVLFLLIFQQAASKIGELIANLFSYINFDPDNVFAWISVHHLMQMAIALIMITILYFVKGWKFGFRIDNVKMGLKYVAFFSVAVFIYAIVFYAIKISLNITTLIQYPLNSRNVCGILGFQLLLSGTSEEILFRALPIVVISNITKSKLCLGKFSISSAILIASILFTVAHIQWSFWPFSINADILQLIQSFIFGIAYGKVFEKSGSILYPAIMHGISNMIMVGMGYIIVVIL